MNAPVRSNKSITRVKKTAYAKDSSYFREKNKDILAVDFAKGSKHELKMLEESHVQISDRALVTVALGYKSLENKLKRCDIPIKKQKGNERTKEEIEFNREIARQRIGIEHINRYLKRFRILGSRYRNKRRKFALRVMLICGIYNLQH